MRIVALLSFFDELPSWLSATVASCGRLCDHIVALDGAYNLFPDGRGSSGAAQHAAIADAAEAVGIGLTLHVPGEKWAGNEVEKRSFMFELGRLVARDERDWYLVIDADEVIIDVPGDARERLASTDCLVAEYGLRDDFDLGTVEPDKQDQFRWVPPHCTHLVRGLYRNTPGLRVEGRHYSYVANIDGRPVDLWSEGPALDLRHLRISHRHGRRPEERNRRARDYYEIRDLAGVERKPEFAGVPA